MIFGVGDGVRDTVEGDRDTGIGGQMIGGNSDIGDRGNDLSDEGGDTGAIVGGGRVNTGEADREDDRDDDVGTIVGGELIGAYNGYIGTTPGLIDCKIIGLLDDELELGIEDSLDGKLSVQEVLSRH
jgi:hypothetical protein